MSNQTLTTYLNDHLAGSVVALELLEHLAALQRGSDREKLFLTLHNEIEQDQKVLQQLLEGLGAKESRAADGVPQLRTLDFARLERRALDQHGLVEAERLEAARLALKP